MTAAGTLGHVGGSTTLVTLLKLSDFVFWLCGGRNMGGTYRPGLESTLLEDLPNALVELVGAELVLKSAVRGRIHDSLRTLTVSKPSVNHRI